MPNCSMLVVDKRPKFPAYLITYSSTSLTIDYCYRHLLGLRFPITEVVIKKRNDGGLDIHAFLDLVKMMGGGGGDCPRRRQSWEDLV